MPTAASARSSSRGSAPSTGCCRRASPERAAKGERLSMARKNPKRPRAARIAPGAAPAPGPLDLEEARGRIDAVDEKIQALINERARLAQQVGISKTSGARTVDFYRPEREAQVLRQAQARNTGPLRDAEILRLFREIMSACLAQQEPLKVAFLGPEGTFTQTAVLNHFGHSVRALPLASIDEVFHEVESGSADFGVVPIENSTEARSTTRSIASSLPRSRSAARWSCACVITSWAP